MIKFKILISLPVLEFSKISCVFDNNCSPNNGSNCCVGGGVGFISAVNSLNISSDVEIMPEIFARFGLKTSPSVTKMIK